MPRSAISLFSIVIAGLLAFGTAGSLAEKAGPVPVAVAHFDFLDTSGEVVDQKIRHGELLVEFEADLRQMLKQAGNIELVALPCGSGRCSLDDPGPGKLASLARMAGARYLVTGGVHKMSTLIGWAKFRVFDLQDDSRVCDRLVTYRGDTQEAWRRAARFGGRDVIRACFQQSSLQ